MKGRSPFAGPAGPADVLARLRGGIPPAIQAAGERLHALSAVDLLRPSLETQLLGRVREQEPQVVSLAWGQSNRLTTIDAGCTCAKAEPGRGCGHIWAVLLAVASSEAGIHLPGKSSLYLNSFHLEGPKKSRLALFTSQGKAKALPASAPGAGKRAAKKNKPKPPAKPDWRLQLDQLTPTKKLRKPARPRRIFYHFGRHDRYYGSHEIEFFVREELANGDWGVLKPLTLDIREVGDLSATERTLIERLVKSQRDVWSASYAESFCSRRLHVRSEALFTLLPSLAATGRFGRVQESPEERTFEGLSFDQGEPWRLVFEGSEQKGDLLLVPRLRRGAGEELPLERVEPIGGSLLLVDRQFAALDERSSPTWLASLRLAPPIRVPNEDVAEALSRLGANAYPPVELDAAWQVLIDEAPPTPALRLALEAYGEPGVELLFVYGQTEIAPDDEREVLPCSVGGKPCRRRRQQEEAFIARLPFELDRGGKTTQPHDLLAPLVEELATEGWLIGTSEYKVRSGGRFKASLSSDIDWFDLEGGLDFGGLRVSLPELLAATKEGHRWVNLSDGTLGLLPPGWLERWTVLARLSRSGGQLKGLRFSRGQALLLHSLLGSQHEVQIDEVFERIRAKLRSFDRLEGVAAPPGFLGELRPYQELGVAWLELLAELRLGGCLADDMGLGKTVQVLAFLLRHRARNTPPPVSPKGRKKAPSAAPHGTHLLVVPKSLVFNWAAEIQRFTPELTFATLHGSSRDTVYKQLGNFDVVITTYGTLARDIAKLQEFVFDTVVLDEAQAIKNRGTQAAAACSSLRANHRLALTGTPVENHLGELWSIFEFLNPGLLGHLPTISDFAGRKSLPPEALTEVAQALRPLILRRKKADVLKELPAKTEQTLVCELSPQERKRYDSLRSFYQASLKQKIAEVGMGKAKIWVLEALLRLRQAACHPGLIDKKEASQSSAKLDLLLENLEQVLEEGHKAIVFSQFTSLLAICRRQLDARKIQYEYLDGKTRDREARVQSFQNDSEMRLFLISLKAGGVGLNLTAASYVFLLDPWWNPAVESQAIDRAHRIGQSQPVFAYRIIAEDTVEEKILQLQESKRALADAIVAGDQRVLKELTAADLEALLG